MIAVAKDPAELWNDAYLRFETPEEELLKFESRLRALGVADWPKELRVAELFCGRGNGLRALAGLGFTELYGVDLSERLASLCEPSGVAAVGDCTSIPIGTGAVDVAIVQGGLHHLPRLPEDLERTVAEVHRVLSDGGRFVVVEPWRTPFLSVVHAVSEQSLARRLSPKIDAFATMVEYERETYERWLSHPSEILAILERWFPLSRSWTRWGKLFFVGTRGARGVDG